MTEPSIAVVGAGIVGCMVARELSFRSPESSIVVIDRDAVGCGASRRSAGLHVPRGATERVRRMTAFSQDYYAVLRTTRPALAIRRLDMCIVAAEASAGRIGQTYLASARLERTSGVPDVVRVPRDAAAWRGDGCQHADVHALARSLASELPPNVSLREGVRVASLEPQVTHVELRLSTGDSLEVERVVLAPGPWLAAPAWQHLLAPLGARVKRVVALHVQQRPADVDPVIVFHDEDAFLLPLVDRGQWLFSYTCGEWDAEPDAPAAGLSADHVDEARRTLARYAPELAERCTAGRVFCDAYSTDGEPVVQALDDAGRLVFAGAANGSGYRLAPAIAAEAAGLLLTSSPSTSWSLA